jgi:histidinol-phosphate aminotransferase
MADEVTKQVSDLFQPWVMTAPVYSIAVCDTAWEHPELGRMMLNENPIPPSNKVVEAASNIIKQGNRYNGTMKSLRAKLADLHGVRPENIAVANGSSETIDAMMRVFMKPGDEFLCSIPTFEMFPSRAGLVGGTTVQVPLREPDLQYDVPGMLAAVTEKTKLMLIINPNNPTGIFIPDDDLITFCELGIPLCVDEAYLDYHPQVESKVPLIEKYPHVFCSHTLSKAYGLAGVRIGYMVGHPDVVEAFTRMYLPWNVSLMAMAAAEAILDNPEEVKEKVEYNNLWMDRFIEELKAKGLSPFPPHGNYMLVDAGVTGKTSQEMVDAAKASAQVIIKTIKPINGREGFFRVTPGTVAENERFVNWVREYFG